MNDISLAESSSAIKEILDNDMDITDALNFKRLLSTLAWQSFKG
jgi:hypothetical protein